MSGRFSVLVTGVLCTAVCGLVTAGAASAYTLPDGRTYEQVTPEEKLGSEAYIPPALGGPRQSTATTRTEYTFQAAADGSGIAYVGGPSVGGNRSEGEGEGNEYLATRSASGGWSSKDLAPEGAPSAIFQAFSPNLTTAFVDSTQPLASSAPGFGEEVFGEDYDTLYSMTTSGEEYVPFFSAKPPHRTISTFGTAYNTANHPSGGEASTGRGGAQFLAFEGASANYGHLLFAANDALTEASEGRPAAEGGEGAEFEKDNNLYELVNGRLRLVNVLPNGTTHVDATFGGLEPNNGIQLRPKFSHAISSEGSRIFWTDLSTGHIYMREDGSRAVEISPEGMYQTATSDGSTVFYTNNDLYSYDVQSGQAVDLTPGVPVERVVGASENGEYIYYVTDSRELMVWHDGVSTRITTLTGTREIKPETTSEVTPDGRSIVFTVRGEETGFGEYQVNVFDYNAESESLDCISCTSHEIVVPESFGSALPMTNAENVYQPRWITADGDRAFFVSVNRLVPQDTNELEDVYEWERTGTGGCAESAGCVNLLSSGTSTDRSLFLDASENGEDVFIVTRSNFVGSDEDGLYDVYDARLNAPPAASAPACSGTGCQGVPSASPIFATPSSVTFEGVGNFAAPAKEAKAKPKPKKKPKRRKKKAQHKKRKSKAKKSARKANSLRRSSSKGGRS